MNEHIEGKILLAYQIQEKLNCYLSESILRGIQSITIYILTLEICILVYVFLMFFLFPVLVAYHCVTNSN